jgi:prolyl-tRNA synthetase
LISVHGDDKGLVLPPEIAPIQVVIIPILFGKSDETLNACHKVEERLKARNMRVVLDETDERPGAKYYKWEMKGVPLRVDLGPRDLKNNAVTVVRRDNGNKENVPLIDIEIEIEKRFAAIHESLLSKARSSLEGRLIACTTIEEVKERIPEGITKIPWCGDRECGLAMEEAVGAGILGIPEGNPGKGSGICPVCKKETENIALMAKTY